MQRDVEDGVRVRLRVGMRVGVGNDWWAMNVSHILLTWAGRTRAGPDRSGRNILSMIYALILRREKEKTLRYRIRE